MSDENDPIEDDEDDLSEVDGGEDVEVLDMTPMAIPVRIKDRNGTVQLYEIRDITGLQRDRFLTEQADKMKLGGNGKPRGRQNFVGFQSSLICLCLWKLNQHVESDGSVSDPDPDKPPTRIAEKIIQSWPARIQQALNKKCEAVSGLGKVKEDETEDEKNDD